MCDAIRGRGGEYLLYAKGNQTDLRDDLEATITVPESGAFSPHQQAAWDDDVRAASTHEKGHGRVERRTITTSTWANEYLTGWPGVAQVFRVERVRGSGPPEVVYGITSLGRDRADAARLLGLVRSHLGIENPQPDCWRSDNLCGPDGTGYHRSGGPVRVGRVVRSTSRPRRRPMSARDPRAPVPRGRLFRRRSGSNSRPNGGGSYTGSSPTGSLDRS